MAQTSKPHHPRTHRTNRTADRKNGLPLRNGKRSRKPEKPACPYRNGNRNAKPKAQASSRKQSGWPAAGKPDSNGTEYRKIYHANQEKKKRHDPASASHTARPQAPGAASPSNPLVDRPRNVKREARRSGKKTTIEKDRKASCRNRHCRDDRYRKEKIRAVKTKLKKQEKKTGQTFYRNHPKNS